MLFLLPRMLTICPIQLRVHAPVVKVRSLECAVQDSTTPQKHTETIISQCKLLDISSHPIPHRPSAINGHCILPNRLSLIKQSATGIGQSVRQFRSDPHQTTHECLMKTVLSHTNSPWRDSLVTPTLCPQLARFCWPHPPSSTLTALACTSAPMGCHTRTSTSPRSWRPPIPRRPMSSTCWAMTSPSPSRPRPTRGVGETTLRT